MEGSRTITTPTLTSAAMIARVGFDGGRWTTLVAGERVAPRVLGVGRLTLLRSQAGPLAGDHDRVEIRVEERAALSIEPVAATVALPGPARTVLELVIEVSDGGTLLLEDAPLVVAEGADVVRTTTIRLGVGATAVVRDLVVLGRAGEGPGRLESVLRVDGPEGPILHDALRIDPASDDALRRARGRASRNRNGRHDRGGARRNAPYRGRNLGHPPGGRQRRSGAGRAHLAGGPLAAGGWLWRASAVSAADVVAQLAAVR